MASKLTAKGVAIRVAIVVVLGFVPTCASMAVFPAGSRIAAPLVCPSDTAQSVVVSRWGGNAKGGSSLKWDLYCLTAEGHGTIPSMPKTVFALVAIWGLLFVGLFLLLRLVARVRGPRAS